MSAQVMTLPQPDFRLLFEYMPGSCLVVNPDLIIVAVTDAYLRATMTERAAILERKLFDVFPDNPDDNSLNGMSSLRASLERVLSTGTGDTMAVQQYDIRRPAADGGGFEVRYWSPVNYPVLGTNGQVSYIIHRVEDVTDFIRTQNAHAPQDWTTAENQISQMQAELYARAQELQQANQHLRSTNDKLTQSQDEIRRLNDELEQRIADRTAELMQMNKDLESFNYSISHDLRTPLRALNGFGQAVLEDYGDRLDAQGQHYLERIRLASQRMSQVIDDLLNLSRISHQEMTRSPVDLSQISHDILSELAANNPSRVVEWIIEPGLVVEGDHSLLLIALQNLLENAWKFTSKNPEARIEIGTSQQGRQPIFFVRDNGAGFDMTYVNKLFMPFQRLHTLAEFEGTGIGLATVQRIIHRHGGSIWIESSLNLGTTLYFTIDAT